MHHCLKLLVPLLILTLTACAPTFEARIAEMAKEISPQESAAVSWIYEDPSGNVTALGDGWRERVEKALRDSKVAVKARKDIGFIIDDLETYGVGVDEQKIWEQAGADVLISGNYALDRQKGGADKQSRIHLTVKALRVKDSALVKTVTWGEELPPGWGVQAATVKGNVFHQKVETVTAVPGRQSGPLLSARLDRSPACFPTGEAGRVLVDTDPGAHVYILNLAADRTVTLLYPNSRMPDQPLPSGRVNFPPKALESEVRLAFYPLNEGEMCQESIKVVASRLPLDFSYLPVPENTIYAGAEGGDIKKVLATLKEARGWSETVLDYWVGPECN